MKRSELEHLIRASGAIADDKDMEFTRELAKYVITDKELLYLILRLCYIATSSLKEARLVQWKI